MEFWLSRSLSQTFLSHDGIEVITERFHELFLLMMKTRLSRSLFTNFSFFTMESRLSQSLFTNFSFLRWNRGYHRAFSRTFLSHDENEAITEPFHKLFFFYDGIEAITEPFHELFFLTMESRLSRSFTVRFRPQLVVVSGLLVGNPF
jgi:hypothetical protein